MATSFDITIKKGADFAMTFTVKDGASARNLTGYTWAGTIRNTFAGNAVASFTFDTTNAATGIIVARLTDTVTAALTAYSTIGAQDREDVNYGVYDIEGTDATGTGYVHRFLEGRVILSLEATQ